MKQYTVDEMKAMARAAAAQHGIDPVMFSAQLQQESGWNTKAVSRAGARGVAQFMPDTAKRFGLANPEDPSQAIPAAAKYMGILKNRYGGDENLARMGYNNGEGNIDKYLKGQRQLPKETAEYNNKIYKIAGVGGGQEQRFAASPQPMQRIDLSKTQDKKPSGNFLDFLFKGTSQDESMPDLSRMQIAQGENTMMNQERDRMFAMEQQRAAKEQSNAMFENERTISESSENMRRILNDMWDNA